jgi:uncharacterized protein (TIGR02466 family)
MMMAVKLLFPTPLFIVDLLDPNLELGLDENYFRLLKREVDEMRKNDPKGRKISNADTGWQSNDGVDKHPAFRKLWKVVEEYITDEVWDFWGLSKGKGHVLDLHNSWANINDKGAWNKPHKHNGCWLSGALYIQAEGDEGAFVALADTSPVMGDFPNSPRISEKDEFKPKTGMLFVFLSGLTHMVEPNLTDNDRYSVSFNAGYKYRTNKGPFVPEGYTHLESLFDITPDGKLLQVSMLEE